MFLFLLCLIFLIRGIFKHVGVNYFVTYVVKCIYGINAEVVNIDHDEVKPSDFFN